MTGSPPPPPVDTFVGRERELADVTKLLTGARLVTLAGTGGVGKTRLAWELSDRLEASFPDGVYRVELAAASQPDLVPVAVVTALHPAKHAAHLPATETVVETLSDGRSLLVLDNCEHLVEACAMFVEILLRRCQHLAVLATSREVLQVPGEVVYRLAGLPARPGAKPVTAADLFRGAATRLFMMRAWNGDPPPLTSGDVSAVDVICRRLDGLPLAIELIAPLARVLPVGAVADQLDGRLLAHTAGALAGPARHRSLWAAFEWSYELLTSDERAVFRRLSVFGGGFAVDGAEWVCAGADVPAEAVLEILTRLEAKSLIVPMRTRDAVPPLRMLESARLYAQEQLVACGEAQPAYERLVAWAAEVARPLMDEAVMRQGRRFAQEVDNLRQALEWLDATRDDRKLLLATGFATGQRLRGHTGYARQLLARALRSAQVDSPYRTLALGEMSLLAFEAERPRAGLRLMKQAVDLERRRGRSALLARLLSLYGRELGWAGDESAAAEVNQECLRVTRACGDDLAAAMVRHNLAWAALRRGKPDEAASWLDGVREVVYAEAGPPLTTVVLHTSGMLAIARADMMEATRCFAELISAGVGSGSAVVLAVDGIEGLAIVAAQTGRPQRCLTLVAAAACLRGSRFEAPDIFVRHSVERAAAIARELLPPVRAEAALAAGGQLTLEAAIDYALADAMPGSGRVAPDPPVRLSARERQIATLVAEGLTNKQIASQLRTSVRTVEAQVRSVRIKLDVRSRAQIAAWFVQHHDQPSPFSSIDDVGSSGA